MISTLVAADAASGNLFQRIIDWSIPIGSYQLHVLEVVGVLIGVVSAWYGMKRWVWAWPIGISANIILFFVYLGALFGADQRIPLFGQAGRQVFFILTSIYGWWRWNQQPQGARRRHRRAGHHAAVGHRQGALRHGGALAAGHGRRAPGLRRALERRAQSLLAAAVVVLLVRCLDLRRVHHRHLRDGSGLERVLAGLDRRRPRSVSRSASRPDYVPTAVMYIFYGMFVLYGFTQWVKATRAAAAAGRAREGDLVAS
jgi:nicotinamide mononucleotide transporter